MTTARERSGKRKAGSSGDVVSVVTIDRDGDVERVEINPATFTFRERHEADVQIGRLIGMDDAGRIVSMPSTSDRALVYAWIVMRRTEPTLSFDALFDLPVGALTIVTDDDKTKDDSSPEV